ncbi:MAG: SAM hydrolase/SAM-dependent halogenase family protein [Longimicrobiales bacterium]
MSSPARITLLTDFGTRDGYVAVVKGVIAALSPSAILDDASHEIQPGDILGAALTLERYWRRYPEGVVHVVVVDPGVGGRRRALAVRADQRFLVGPDNGVFSRVLAGAQHIEAREITSVSVLGGPVSPTFHGRDVFAPAAAWLANGGALAELGPHAAHLIKLPALEVVVHAEGMTGEVIDTDRFGNLITSIGVEASGAANVSLGAMHVGPVRRTYSDVASGEAIALIGSHGLLEIAVRDSSAAKRFGAVRGTRVEVQR